MTIHVHWECVCRCKQEANCLLWLVAIVTENTAEMAKSKTTYYFAWTNNCY